MVAFSFASASIVSASSRASQEMYQSHQIAVYQIRLINMATGEKNTIGSGFQISADGLIATNFHVISQAIRYPNRYRIEAVHADNEKDVIQLLDVDAVHDLAVLKTNNPEEKFLKFGTSELSKGQEIYSFGNPFDLGMTIVDGIYNGLMKNALYKKILFSGSINPGMSGGPALDQEGNIIGVNVSTAGNQISFFVPVEYLKMVEERVRQNNFLPIANWYPYIEQQLIDNQSDFLTEIMQSEWKTLSIGKATVPGEFSDKFKCWGELYDEKKQWITNAYTSCSTEDEIFLSNQFTTGKILYKYMWMKGRTYNPIRFYTLYEKSFSQPQYYANAGDEDVEDFKCRSEFVDIHGTDFKSVLCARQYKNFPKLFDINVSLASLNYQDRGLLVEVIALGVEQNMIMTFVKRFMENIQCPR